MAGPNVEIERVTTPSGEHVEALTRLLPQLSSADPPSLDGLKAITSNEATYLYVARVDRTIVGSLSLATFAIPTGLRAWIEDVVVDAASRGQGVASALVRAATDQAKLLGASSIDLTSRPSRVDANRLYQQLGFTQRETNVYRITL